VTENWLALEYASTEFKDDKEIVLEAVKQAGYAGDFASEELRCEMAECWAECIEQETKND
jgi:hypothetical protein